MKKLSGVDGIRTIACFLILFHHAFQKLAIPGNNGMLLLLYKSFNTSAPAAVSIFFVLSGFLLAIPFWEKYFKGKDLPDTKSYILRRAGRIMPGFYIALTVTFIIQFFYVKNHPVTDLIIRYLAGLSFVSGFNWRTFFPAELNSPLWVISYEAFSYLLLPLCMIPLFLFRRESSSFKKKIVIVVINWTIVFFLLFTLNGLIVNNLQNDPVGRGWEYGLQGGAKLWMPNYNPLGLFAHFALGIMTSFIMILINRYPEFNERLKRWYVFDFIVIISLLIMFILLGTRRLAHFFYESFQGQPYCFPVFTLSAALPLALLPFTKFCGKILDNTFFKFTAQISFGIYLWHHLIMSLVEIFIAPDFRPGGVESPWRWLGLTGVVILVSYLIASLSWFFIEKPVHDKVRKITAV